MENVKSLVTIEEGQIDEIKELSLGNPYKKGKRADHGKTYSTFAFDGTPFNVDDATGFADALRQGNVNKVKLLKFKREAQLRDAAGQLLTDDSGNPVMGEVDTFEFDTFVHFAKIINRAKQQAVLQGIKSVAQADKLDERALKALLSIGV